MTIGACATAGGIQALRNFTDVDEFVAVVYASPEYIETLATSTPIAAHVKVDFELRGCPIDKPSAARGDRCVPARPQAERSGATASASSASCAAPPASWWRTGTPCLGPVTQAGCGAICPSYARGCYGCFGPMEAPNTAALAAGGADSAWTIAGLVRVFRTFNATAEAFRKEGQAHGTQ